MEGDERLRLFLALRLPDEALDEVEAWQRAELPGGVRLVPRADLHVTLAFLGSRPAGELAAVAAELRGAAAGARDQLRLTPVRYRETRSVAMLVLEDEQDRAAALAADVQERLERLGVFRREPRPWLPHVTVARFRQRPRLRPAEPRVRTFVPSDAAAYLSRLRRSGARYEVLESVALGSLGGE
ncbi:MAG TPA: RNA 2',3'-cyclic phosphodiesterase [Gaiellaceae bacterium]|nr:RNA 2',3'-cyclic phosphodiesterase [Gaiellaceae bacterium]